VIHDSVEAAALQHAGQQAFPGFRLCALSSAASTQDVVRSAARAGAAPGYCCMAGSQSAGRGRQDRRWTAPPGSALLCSILVRLPPAHLSAVPIAAGLALRAAISAISGYEARLKWPNDILAGPRKLAGILCEAEPAAPGAGAAVVVGMGVNLAVPAFPDGVAGVSLHELVSSPPSAAALLAGVLPELAERLRLVQTGGVIALRSEWMDHAAGVGETVTATSAAGTVTGAVEGIDDDGALLLRTATGRVRLLAGDVHIGIAPGA
jgi:BirA family biotin operon repressor/biotin-[acetyl-CoA-carboxylase] ligase